MTDIKERLRDAAEYLREPERADFWYPTLANELRVSLGRDLVDILTHIEKLEAELRHCSVFIRTREKMHPDGIALFDELLGEQE